MKKVKIAFVILIIAAIVLSGLLISMNNTEVKKIKSEKELYEIMEGKTKDDRREDFKDYISASSKLLFEILGADGRSYKKTNTYGPIYEVDDVAFESSSPFSTIQSNNKSQSVDGGNSKDYSRTNIQVENVDEADITKTDGDYVYSISGSNVIITDVRNPKEIKIASRINGNVSLIPEDLVLYGNKLVVIYCNGNDSDSSTIVKTYDISFKEKPREIKSFELKQKYYTSRCIDNKLFVIASGTLECDDEDEHKVNRAYFEDGEDKKMNLHSIKYLKDVPSNVMTVITCEDLDDVESDIKINPFLMDVSNAYVSEHGIYLLNQEYVKIKDKEENSPLGTLFGLGGFREFIDLYDEGEISSYSRELSTVIYKFNIQSDEEVNFVAKNFVDGKTINQYSMDEDNGHFRIATYDFNKGAKVSIYNENLELIGESSRVGKNENMYATRFMGSRAYVVTYRTTDPLFVIDLSNERHPKVLGELSIPGYSTYLHPYDENHIIGIGMNSSETVNRDSSGRVSSTSARLTGMKMALFDVSDVRNPIQMSEALIGDSRTSSAVLDNPKALLFSKEKELIAIPVNNYDEDEINADELNNNSTTYKYKENRISEGYIVYKINLEDGFVKKGTITHEYVKDNPSYKYSYKTASKMLRGLYIENNLYTVSEEQIKVNDLETLQLISELYINRSNDNMKKNNE